MIWVSFCEGEELVKPARNGLERMMKREGWILHIPH